MKTKTAVVAAILAMTLAAPLAAFAQTKTATEEAAEHPRRTVEQHIADMYASLHITQAQEVLWDQFAQVMLDNAQAMHDVTGKTSSASVEGQTADVILQGYARITEQHAVNTQRLSAAFSMLYATMSAEQKAAADEMFRATVLNRVMKK